MKWTVVALLVILGFMTSCQKEEPIEPLTPYNQTNPPMGDPSFVGSTWVIYKFQTLYFVTSPELVSDTLKFINNTELTYNGIPCEYSFYQSGWLWYFELKQTPRFVGNINSYISESPVNYGEILSQEFTNVYNRNQKWLVWMKKYH